MVGVVGSSPIVPTNILWGLPRLSGSGSSPLLFNGDFLESFISQKRISLRHYQSNTFFFEGVFPVFSPVFDIKNFFHLNKGFFHAGSGWL